MENEVKISRGCVLTQTTQEETCKIASGNQDNGEIKNCHICTENECNHATSLVVKSITILFTTSLAIVFALK